jgi:alanine racemase
MRARRSLSQWIDLEERALRQNLGVFRKVLEKGTLMAAVVKANAYGHGLAEVAPLAARGADWLAVHSAEEARRIRRLGVRSPILIMGFIPESELHDLDSDTHLFVSTAEVLRWVGAYRRRSGISLPVHLKVDTGTKRQGVAVHGLRSLCRAVAEEGLEVVGVATHFANIEDTLEHEFARLQISTFDAALETVRRELGEDPPYIHAACSAAALLFRETDFNLVRVGISMYGHWPSRETQLTWILEHGRDGVRLEPVLSWKTLIGQLQDVAKGETVGYGRTWTALRTTRLAVLPVGYADGYDRKLGNRARVLIRGRRVPVVGRVCMNIMMVDVTDVPEAEVGDEVVLIGRQDGAAVSAEELAGLADTINYEVLARLSPDIPRFVVGVSESD